MQTGSMSVACALQSIASSLITGGILERSVSASDVGVGVSSIEVASFVVVPSAA